MKRQSAGCPENRPQAMRNRFGRHGPFLPKQVPPRRQSAALPGRKLCRESREWAWHSHLLPCGNRHNLRLVRRHQVPPGMRRLRRDLAALFWRAGGDTQWLHHPSMRLRTAAGCRKLGGQGSHPFVRPLPRIPCGRSRRQHDMAAKTEMETLVRPPPQAAAAMRRWRAAIDSRWCSRPWACPRGSSSRHGRLPV